MIWGSTFLGIRVTVRPGAGFPPFTMGATRLAVAGGLLFLISFFRGRRILPSRRELVTMAGSGILLWGMGNGLVVWAEQRADSGLAALMIGSSAYQHFAGALWMSAAAWILGEPAAAPTPAAWLAWLYLVLFGGLAFTSYVQALRLLPINVAMTHAYVNPVIAVFLGWLILGEAITPWTVAGAALVLLGVAGVFQDRWARRRGNQILP